MINILVRQRRCLSEINIVTRHWLTLSSRFSLIRATLNSDITWSWSMRFGSSDHSWIQFNNAEFTFIGNNRHRHFRTRQRPYCWFSRCAVRCLRTGSSKLPGNLFLSLLSVSFTQEWVMEPRAETALFKRMLNSINTFILDHKLNSRFDRKEGWMLTSSFVYGTVVQF